MCWISPNSLWQRQRPSPRADDLAPLPDVVEGARSFSRGEILAFLSIPIFVSAFASVMALYTITYSRDVFEIFSSRAVTAA